MSEKRMPSAVRLLIPILTAVLCGGITAIAAIKPYEKIETYVRVAFMDNSNVIPKSDGIAGLKIVETDIDTKYDGVVKSAGDIKYPEYGTQYAVLECERLEMFVPIYFGSGSELLELGGCNAPSSSVIGDDGNTVISAHVNTFFMNLSELKKGDEIKIYTEYGRFTYKVKEEIEFKSSDKKYITQKKDNLLTLYTCEADLLAESDKRVGAVCELEKREFYVSEEESEK